MKPNFFRKFFRRKCSLGSCATFSENMVSVFVLGFEKFASQVLKFGTCHELCEKKRHHMGISQSPCPKNKTESNYNSGILLHEAPTKNTGEEKT